MNQNYNKIKSNNLSTDEKKGCALVLSYYTGKKDNSDRSSRNTNVLIRGQNLFTKVNGWNDGHTVRCVNMESSILNKYVPGTVITWLQFSSSKIGKEPAPAFADRNTWFHIYSFSSREISQLFIPLKKKLCIPLSLIF